MEKWKIATIAALLLALIGFGIVQQNNDKQATTAPAGATPVPAAAIYLGKTLPPWNFKTWSSKAVPVASLNGKPAMVEIFRTECPHCRDAAPFLSALQNRYGARGFKIVSIQSPGDFKDAQNPENNWAKVQTWIKEYKVNYPVAFDEGSQYFQGTIQKQILKDDASKLLYPTTLLLDPAGKIVFAQTGHDTEKAIALAVALEKLFPGAGSVAQNGADLAKWLVAQLPELQEMKTDATLFKAFDADIAQRLQP